MGVAVTRIAHLSDLHLGLPGRRERLDRALSRAAHARATHLCLTGDLTESGLERDFEDLSDALQVWNPRAVTIVPGNHDLQAGTPWSKVLAPGAPLRRFAPTSFPSSVTMLGDAAIVAISTQYQRRALVFRALGKVDEDDLNHLGYLSERFYGVPVVACMHHPPTDGGVFGFFAGLTNRRDMRALIDSHSNLHLLCGHDHEALDDGNIHVAPALAESSLGYEEAALRLYDVRGPSLVPV